MKRASVLRLRDELWFAPLDEHPELEICIIPSAASVLMDTALLGSNRRAESVCREVFVNFRGYEDDDGSAIENSLAARKELYSLVQVQIAISNKISEQQEEAIQGEGSAVSA